MNRSTLVPIVVLILGVALLAWGLQAYESLSSGMSEAFQGAPSNKSIVLLAAGAILTAVGLVRLVRRA